MSEGYGKSIHEIHLGFVEQLKARGENVVQPRGEPMGHIKGYDKTIGLISAGTIAVSREFYGGDFALEVSSFDLIQDHFTHAYTGVKWEDIGLCDAKCWYEAIEDQRQERVKANKGYAGKQATDLPRVELIPLLKQEHIIEILSGIIDVIQQEKEDREDEKENHEGTKVDPFLSTRHWKQDFIARLEIPIEIKKMLGYKEE